jgi:predicted RNA-binding protein with PUA-like domain
MAYWLVKSEPSSYSWDQLVADGRTHWNGVRNAQALNNLRAMKPGDQAFFYHSNEGKEIVGVVEVVKGFYPDPIDQSGKLGMVDVKPVMPVAVKVGLPAMRANPELSGLSLLRQSRLSVCPVSEREWIAICGWQEFPPEDVPRRLRIVTRNYKNLPY